MNALLETTPMQMLPNVIALSPLQERERKAIQIFCWEVQLIWVENEIFFGSNGQQMKSRLRWRMLTLHKLVLEFAGRDSLGFRFSLLSAIFQGNGDQKSNLWARCVVNLRCIQRTRHVVWVPAVNDEDTELSSMSKVIIIVSALLPAVVIGWFVVWVDDTPHW